MEEELITGMLEREVEDRSDSDGFAKFIAVGQISWFVVKLLAWLA